MCVYLVLEFIWWTLFQKVFSKFVHKINWLVIVGWPHWTKNYVSFPFFISSQFCFYSFSPSAPSSAEARTACSADPRPTSPTRNPVKISDQKSSRPTTGTSSTTMASASSPHPNSIVNKPARGWLHPDYLFAKDGINYNVRVSQKETIWIFF